MKTIDTFQNRLQKALTIRNMKSVELHEKTEISESLLSKYLSGNAIARQKKLSALADVLDVNEVWLMGYDVPMQKEFKTESNAFPTADIPIKIPVLGKISAGLPILAVENIESEEFAPSSYIKPDYEYFYLKVQGDSMNLKFNDGDIVLVQKQNTLENEEIGVVLVNGFDATVKKYKYENNFVILSPLSTNPEHTVQIYNPKETEIKIVGKVVAYQGKI